MEKIFAPTIFVIFGVSGDLAKTKILPALNHLLGDNLLPEKFSVVGVSRRPWGKEEYLKHVASSVGENVNEKFLNRNFYVQGNFGEDELYENLKKELARIDDEYKTCSNKLLYLAVPPNLYEIILEKLSSSGLSVPCGGDLGWTRILVEKPFGSDSKNAILLDKKLGKIFKEEQIFRIDHYLAKENIQNILAFRFSNSIFEPLWNRKHIRAVKISLFEKNGVGDRGAFYDKIGALKDVGQNHLLQMLALVTMSKPKSLSAEDIRKERVKILKNLAVPEKDSLFRGQYRGYLGEKGVAPNSETETYFSFKTSVKNHRWRGVPFYLLSGKGLAESRVQIDVYFEDDESSSFLPQQHSKQEQNRLTFKIQPREGISILFWSKVPGFENKIEQKELSFEYGNGGRKIDAYEKVLRDCILGDQTLFTSTEEVLSAWKFIEKILNKFPETELHSYDIGSNGPKICEDFIKT